jgi:Rieske Fe-S protein
MKPTGSVERRVFLKTILAVGAGATSVLEVACGQGADGTAASFGDLPAGPASALGVGDVKIVPGGPAVIARDSGGVYAMTITCTHRGCDVAPNASGASTTLDCPCHGSRFDANGNVIRGPAGAPLVHFAVAVDAAGNLTVHGGTEVAASVRVAV